jgi:hypothetical protein
MSRFISVGSRQRTSGNTNSFKLKLTNPITDVRLIKAMQVTFTHSWYTVMTGINDIIYFDVGGTPYQGQLTQGAYNIAGLVTEIASAMNTIYLVDNNFGASASSLTRKITITHTVTNFTLTFSNTTASASKLLGFNNVDTSPAGLTFTGNNLYNLSHDDTVFLKSRTIGSGMSNVDDKRGSFILAIPVNTNFGGVINFRALGEKWHILYRDSKGKSFNDLDFELYFEDLTTLVPLNGMDLRITFTYVDSCDK